MRCPMNEDVPSDTCRGKGHTLQARTLRAPEAGGARQPADVRTPRPAPGSLLLPSPVPLSQTHLCSAVSVRTAQSRHSMRARGFVCFIHSRAWHTGKHTLKDAHGTCDSDAGGSTLSPAQPREGVTECVPGEVWAGILMARDQGPGL